MRLYMLVTKDQYELPLVVAGSAEELAKRVGVSPKSIYSAIWKAEKYGRKCKYRVVDVEDEAEDPAEK